MEAEARRRRWDEVYTTKRESEVSWWQERPEPSLELIAAAGATLSSKIVDIGGGASRLVDALLAQGFRDITVLDLSEAALAVARSRLGDLASRVRWIAADVTVWEPKGLYDIWHDRAGFHFLTEPEDRAAYVERMKLALAPGGDAIIGTFAPDGPERCSGLPVRRYSAESLAETLGPAFGLVTSRTHDHVTPRGAAQSFQFSLFRREGDRS